MIRTTTARTRDHLIRVLDARRTSVRDQADMWLDELETETDLFDTQVQRYTARIQRLQAEAKLRTRQIDALEIWTSVDVGNRDIEAVQLLKEQYEGERDRAILRAHKLHRSAWPHDQARGDEATDRAAILVKYIDLLIELLS